MKTITTLHIWTVRRTFNVENYLHIPENLLGDLAFTSAMSGHSGQSSTMPVVFTSVTKKHLTEDHKDGSPHNLK